MLSYPPLLLIAGAKGAVGSTVAAAIAAMKKDPDTVLPWLTTAPLFDHLGPFGSMEFSGWDVSPESINQAIEHHKVLPNKFLLHEGYLGKIRIHEAPSGELPLHAQVEQLIRDIEGFKALYPKTHPVLINLLPACRTIDLSGLDRLDRLYSHADPTKFPDLAYALAAILSSMPVVNFTSNALELPVIVEEALKAGVPCAAVTGRPVRPT